jgi:tRNA-specific 2-thiouridylase
MSGGVDSSLAAALLVERGFDVVGVTMRVWAERGAGEPGRFGSCCGADGAADARRVAARLGVPHYVLNTEDEFERTVVGAFVDEYRAGRTPVPCLACNTDLKFGSVLARARAWGAASVATGHYARVSVDAASGRHRLWRAVDTHKDQTYFLWPLTQRQLAGARFPVGDLTKAQVRAEARRRGLATAEKPESQGICFVPGGDYRAVIRRRAPGVFAPGPVVDQAGAVVGRHAGLAGFTVGQRKGLGLATGTPQYVVRVDTGTNTLTVGGAEALLSRRLRARRVNFIAFDRPPDPVRVEGRIRHNHVPAPATSTAVGEDEAELVFDDPQRAVTPGQSVVWYQGDLVIGGGVIADRD